MADENAEYFKAEEEISFLVCHEYKSELKKLQREYDQLKQKINMNVTEKNENKVGMPTPESASAAAYVGQSGGMPYGSAPPGGAPGYGQNLPYGGAPGYPSAPPAGGYPSQPLAAPGYPSQPPAGGYNAAGGYPGGPPQPGEPPQPDGASGYPGQAPPTSAPRGYGQPAGGYGQPGGGYGQPAGGYGQPSGGYGQPTAAGGMGYKTQTPGQYQGGSASDEQRVGMPTPESASAAAYGGQPGGMLYGSAPPGGAPGYGMPGAGPPQPGYPQAPGQNLPYGGAPGYLAAPPAGGYGQPQATSGYPSQPPAAPGYPSQPPAGGYNLAGGCPGGPPEPGQPQQPGGAPGYPGQALSTSAPGGYGQPAGGYGQPAGGYGQPAGGYGQPSAGYRQHTAAGGMGYKTQAPGQYQGGSGSYKQRVGIPNPESASAAAYGGQTWGMPYGGAPPGGAPGYGMPGAGPPQPEYPQAPGQNLPFGGYGQPPATSGYPSQPPAAPGYPIQPPAGGYNTAGGYPGGPPQPGQPPQPGGVPGYPGQAPPTSAPGGYGLPAGGYGQPAGGYGQPSGGYGQPTAAGGMGYKTQAPGQYQGGSGSYKQRKSAIAQLKAADRKVQNVAAEVNHDNILQQNEQAAKEDVISQLASANQREETLQATIHQLKKHLTTLWRAKKSAEAELTFVKHKLTTTSPPLRKSLPEGVSARTQQELRTEVEVLRQQLLVFREDFGRERQDWATAQSVRDDLKKKCDQQREQLRLYETGAWACTFCTFINSPDGSVCDMCGYKKQSASRSNLNGVLRPRRMSRSRQRPRPH